MIQIFLDKMNKGWLLGQIQTLLLSFKINPGRHSRHSPFLPQALHVSPHPKILLLYWDKIRIPRPRHALTFSFKIVPSAQIQFLLLRTKPGAHSSQVLLLLQEIQ